MSTNQFEAMCKVLTLNGVSVSDLLCDVTLCDGSAWVAEEVLRELLKKLWEA